MKKNLGVIFLSLIVLVVMYFKYNAIILNHPWSDFDAYYVAAKNIIAGKDIYRNPFVMQSGLISSPLYYIYPPLFAFLLSKIIFLTYFTLESCVLILNLLMIPLVISSLYFLVKIFNLKLSFDKFYMSIFSLIFVSSAWMYNEANLQINLFIFFLIINSILLFLNKKFFLSGIFFAFSIYIKPIHILLLFPFFICKKWKFFFSFFLTCFLFTIWIILDNPRGINVFFDYISSIGDISYFIYGGNQNISFIKAVSETFKINKSMIQGSIILFYLWFIIKNRNKKNRYNFLQNISLSIVISLLISPVLWLHHYIYLLLPIIFIMLKMHTKCFYVLFIITCFFLYFPFDILPFSPIFLSKLTVVFLPILLFFLLINRFDSYTAYKKRNLYKKDSFSLITYFKS